MPRDLTERTSPRVQAAANEGAGYGSLPGQRNLAHADPQWFEMDLDEDIDDPDEPFVDPLPTPRHRGVV